MAETTYVLRRKVKNENVLQNADELRKGIKHILRQISKLGYDSETAKEIKHILHRKNGHEAFLSENKENETILLAQYITGWKPAFHSRNGYDNLVDMKKFCEWKAGSHEIVKSKGKTETVLTWDEFLSSIKKHRWTGFGMPEKYNKEEDTIWENIR